MSEAHDLREAQTFTGPPKVDRSRCLIEGVKVLGLSSGNGNDYTVAVLEKALPLYESRKVNLDHPLRRAKGEDRKVSERWGKLQNARVAADGLYGDLLYNPHHPMTETLLWWAENMPDCIGLSQYGWGTGRKKPDGRWQVESIDSVTSVDLVADPATTKSLFEAQEPDMPEPAAAEPPMEAPDHQQQMADAFANAVMAVVKDTSMDLQAKMKKIKDILKAQEKLMAKADADETDSSDEEAMTESLGPEQEELAQLRKEKQVRALCESMGYAPDALILEALCSLQSEDRRREMITREAARPKGSKPRSAAAMSAAAAPALKQGKELASSLRKMR